MIITIAWKNIWRNKLRSFVVLAAIAIGLLGGIAMAAVAVGMVEQRIDTAIKNETAHIQLHDSAFQANMERKYYINNADQRIAEIEKLPEVKAASKRLKMEAMGNRSGNSAALIIFGVEPEKEQMVSGIHSLMCDSCGNYFESESRTPPIVIGGKLARKLKMVEYRIDSLDLSNMQTRNVEEEYIEAAKALKDSAFRKEKDFLSAYNTALGQEISGNAKAALVQQATKYKLRKKILVTLSSLSGDLVGANFRVVGIFETNNSVFDEMNVFVQHAKLAELTGFESDHAHEIAVSLQSMEHEDAALAAIQKQNPELKVELWSSIMPSVGMQAEFVGMMLYIFILIVLLALGFGIINTMLMVILERIKELGMLMAIGMNRLKIFLMIMMESVLLCLTGGAVGMLIAYGLIEYFNHTGIDIGAYAEGMESMGYATVIYPQITPDYFINITILVILTGVLSAIYPAIKALRLNPTEALRTE